MPNKVYAIVFVDVLDGKEKISVSTFQNEQLAMIEVNKIKKNIEHLKIDNYKIYLSKLNYDVENNKILDKNWVNEESILKIEC